MASERASRKMPAPTIASREQTTAARRAVPNAATTGLRISRMRPRRATAQSMASRWPVAEGWAEAERARRSAKNAGRIIGMTPRRGGVCRRIGSLVAKRGDGIDPRGAKGRISHGKEGASDDQYDAHREGRGIGLRDAIELIGDEAAAGDRNGEAGS